MAEMNAILFSADPNMVRVDDAVRHLSEHPQLYWEVGFQISTDGLSFPLEGFIHVKGGQVEYKTTIHDIIPFSRDHYENLALAQQVKPEPWLRGWRENLADRAYPWRNALVMTDIYAFSYDTYSFQKVDGTPVRLPPQSYIRVRSPRPHQWPPPPQPPITSKQSPAERHLEDFVVQQLDAIEPGLRLESRQLSTPAGRLDLLCRDVEDNYVVVELKTVQGTDQVMGQILRYMGWLKEAYGTEKIRGIIIAGSKNQALSYAVKAVPNVQVKEFKLVIQ